MDKESVYLKIKKRLLKDKASIIILGLYLMFCSISCVYGFINISVRTGVMSLLFILFIPALFVVEGIFKMRFPSLLLFMLYFLAIGAILGSCYELYNTVPIFDSILHLLSGIIFACIGFSLMKVLVGEANTTKKFIACLLGGVSFSLMIAVVWEIFEYSINMLLGYDMMEDTFVSGFNSYVLSGTHNEYVEVNGIEKTIIYYDSGKVLTIDGYMDIGLIDTMHDMIICTSGAIMFIVYTCLSHFKFKKMNELLIPKVYSKDS